MTKRAVWISVSALLAAAATLAAEQTARPKTQPPAKASAHGKTTAPARRVTTRTTALPPPNTARTVRKNQAVTRGQRRPAPALGAFKPVGKSGKGEALTIPKDAKQVDASTWRWTDAKGTAWIYRKTPFGISHYREEEEKQREMSKGPDVNPTRVTDAGDSYKFERPTPFGVQRWTKKKADLTDSEKDMVKEAQARASAVSSKGRQ